MNGITPRGFFSRFYVEIELVLTGGIVWMLKNVWYVRIAQAIFPCIHWYVSVYLFMISSMVKENDEK